jgi:hypothetical protein
MLDEEAALVQRLAVLRLDALRRDGLLIGNGHDAYGFQWMTLASVGTGGGFGHSSLLKLAFCRPVVGRPMSCAKPVFGRGRLSGVPPRG